MKEARSPAKSPVTQQAVGVEVNEDGDENLLVKGK